MSAGRTRSTRSRATRTAQLAVLCVVAVVMVAPLVFGLYVSLLPPGRYLQLVGPGDLTLENYAYVFDHAPVGTWYRNTLVVTALVVGGAVLVNTLAGYALARFRFAGRRWLMLGVIAILLVPLQAYLIPLYLQVSSYGWLNSLVALVVPFIVNPLLIFLMRQTFSTLPPELDDAAAVDGAGRFRVFLQIGVPLAMTGIATQAILAGTWTWNSFLIPVTMVNDPDQFVLTVGLNSLQAQNYTLPTVQMAGVVLLTIPVVVMFVVFQRFIVPSLASSGIKG
ncbi:carbohydrate ABC transporter permease [Cellulomonas hominis]|uniref:carbohydrate ABC transporter permease n=1 Tax=Cellulomonas hominis TaxID=156981 RepID=UPI001B90A9AB|nr:carbohydrate ABC transporter permease [Cellulomonas hominis]VTR78404.1 L-arabinose transport system permease protein AraQ [Cellulomonas hominis]